MRILLLAPHPFYQERGTPIAVDLLLRALSERGDEVDLLTFHEGADRVYPGVRIHRIRPLLPIRHVRPGFSLKKLVCDVHMSLRFAAMFLFRRYDVVHAVEESAFMAMLLCPLKRTPFFYDMDSSMTTQIVDKHRIARWVERPMRFLESLPMRRAAAVIPVCDALADEVYRHRTDKDNVLILKDVSLLDGAKRPDAPSLRLELPIAGKIAMYIGNLESYQGIDLMLESFAILRRATDQVDLVIIGGAEADVTRYRDMAERLGIADAVHLLGPRPVGQIGAYMAQAEMLVSPRTQGVNTPMKVYSYLHSGRAVLATRLPTHTQVMTDEIAMLAAPDPEAFAAAWHTLYDDPPLRERLAAAAHRYIEREHSYAAFTRRLYDLYGRFDPAAARG